MFSQIEKSELLEIASSDLVVGNRYLMVDRSHSVVVTVSEFSNTLAVQIEKSFLVGFFAMLHTAILIDQIGDGAKFFELPEDCQ
jgi:hypothetical protein